MVYTHRFGNDAAYRRTANPRNIQTRLRCALIKKLPLRGVFSRLTLRPLRFTVQTFSSGRSLAAIYVKMLPTLRKIYYLLELSSSIEGLKGSLGKFRQGMALASIAAMSLDDFMDRRPMEAEFAGDLPDCTT